MSDLVSEQQTVIIGAGPAGLAVGACLEQAGLPGILLEQSDRVGASWHRHYDRLHLHTDKKNSELPFLPFPRDYPRYPSRQQVIRYLESYAQAFELDIRFRQQVTSVRYENDRWVIQTQADSYTSSNLVIATGYNNDPILPTWPGQQLYRGTILHSCEYRNGRRFKDKNVLVVGFGNSGGEIAIDLCEENARVGIAVRSPVNVIPRELLGIPILAIGILQSRFPASLADALNAAILRAAIGDLTQYGLRQLPYGPVTQMRRRARIPLIDVGTIDLIKNGRIIVYPGIREFTEEAVIFEDGKSTAFDAVILATGYRPRVSRFLAHVAAATCDGNGLPLLSGQESGMPGLYFCGFYVSPTGMLREIRKEARQIAAGIAAQQP